MFPIPVGKRLLRGGGRVNEKNVIDPLRGSFSLSCIRRFIFVRFHRDARSGRDPSTRALAPAIPVRKSGRPLWKRGTGAGLGLTKQGMGAGVGAVGNCVESFLLASITKIGSSRRLSRFSAILASIADLTAAVGESGATEAEGEGRVSFASEGA